MSHLTNLSQFDFQRPLLIYQSDLETLDPDRWDSGEEWIEGLAKPESSGLKGIVLPLELNETNRQRLWGVELLSWLRWSGSEAVRYVPVLVVAWQSLIRVLHKKANLLLIAEGTRFLRLPEAAENGRKAAAEFVSAAREGHAKACDEKILEKYAGSGCEEVARVTYHDLANDFYAADRIWAGYLCALRDATDQLRGEDKKAVQVELDLAEKVQLKCQREIAAKKTQPWFKQFQVAARKAEVPAYPEVEFPQALLAKHVRYGLPKNARILFVDDEYEKGTAEALLRIFFKTTKFNKETDGEWVYSEQTDAHSPSSKKARFVCVKDAERARYWLVKWGELDLAQSELGFESWYRNWARVLRVSEFPPGNNGQEAQTALDLAREALAPGTGKSEVLDNDAASPVRMTTIVLLDLRLDKKGLGPMYAVRDLPSVRLRTEIKDQEFDLPVIIFTASRQAMNFAEIMEDATEIDGWLCKEAPDMKEDDQNSKRALQYLLARIHLFAGARAWYRMQLGWDIHRMKAYGTMFDSGGRDTCLTYVDQKASELFTMVKSGQFAEQNAQSNKGLLGFIQERIQFPQFADLTSVLIARRLAVATLLFTSQVRHGVLEWDALEFIRRLRGDYARKKANSEGKRYPSKAVNFRRECWLASYEQDKLVNLLLTEEVDWLRRQEWPRNQESIQKWIEAARSFLNNRTGQSSPAESNGGRTM